MDIEKLRARLKELNASAKAIVAAADKDNNGVMTAEQQAQYDAAIDEFDKVKAQIDRHERVQRMAADLGESTGRVTLPAQARSEHNEQRERRGGFDNLAEFGRAVHAACRPGGGNIDERLLGGASLNPQAAPSGFHREGGTDMGYLVPTEYRDRIWELVFEQQDLLGEVDSEPTNSNSVEFLKDETTPWGSAGIQARWRAEGTQMLPSTIDLGKDQVRTEELYAFVLATGELLQDAPRLQNRLTVKAAQAINWKISESIIYGTGAGQPKGWANSNALITVAKESGQAADTVKVENIVNMYIRMLGSSLSRSYWMMNSDVLPQLITMTLPNGNPIWTPPATGIANAPGGFLLGRPIRYSDHAKTLGDKGDIQFVDPKGYYAITKRSGVQFDSSIHLFFDYNIEAFRWMFRFGGQPYLSAPVTPPNGNTTKSHFVTLAERA